MRTEDTLVYDAPSANWLEALPLGNGRLGAMVFGGRALPGSPAREHRFQLNDGSAWSGSPHSQDLEPHFSRERADRILAESRRLIRDGDYAAAHETLKELQHRHSQSYLPFADVFLTLGLSGGAKAARPAAGGDPAYSRTLDLARAVNSTRYEVEGHSVSVEAFASHEPSVLVISVETDAPQGLDLTLRLDSQLRILRRAGAPAPGPSSAGLELKLPSDVPPSHDVGAVEYSDDDSLSLQGAVAAAWEHNGTEAEADDGGLAATGARRAVLYITTETTFRGLGRQPEGTAAGAVHAARKTLAAAMAAGREALLARHEHSHAELYNSCSITMDTPAWQGANTAHRLAAANTHPDGPLARTPDWRRCSSTTGGTC